MSPLRRPRPTSGRSAVALPTTSGPGRTVLTGVVAGAVALSVAACGANRDAQTYQERSQADASNVALGTLALRGVAVLPPEDDRTYREGDDAEVTFVVSNKSAEDDVLEEVTTEAASSVEVLVDGEPGTVEVPALGSTGNTGSLRLVGLTEELREGEFVELTFRFRENGSIDVPVPVAISGQTDRPVYTGTEEEEPALQAPAGGHEESGSEGESEAENGEPGEGDLAEAEPGQDTGDEAPREDQAEEPSESATDESEAPS